MLTAPASGRRKSTAICICARWPPGGASNSELHCLANYSLAPVSAVTMDAAPPRPKWEGTQKPRCCQYAASANRNADKGLELQLGATSTSTSLFRAQGFDSLRVSGKQKWKNEKDCLYCFAGRHCSLIQFPSWIWTLRFHWGERRHHCLSTIANW